MLMHMTDVRSKEGWPMIDEYLNRIDYKQPVRPDVETLFGIHRAHIQSIPYENLDIQLGRENVLSETAFYDKLIRKRRGGWCYEMNGLITQVLGRIGFRIVRVGGAVRRKILGDQAIGNHLLGLVDLDKRYVVDVGLGDGPLNPYVLKEGEWTEAAWRYRLEKLDDGWWRFHNHQYSFAETFDFTEEPHELEWYQDMSTFLQTNGASPFVNYAMVFRRSAEGFRFIRDTIYFEGAQTGRTEHEIKSGTEYRRALSETLGQDLKKEEVDTLWTIVQERARCRLQP